VNNKTEHSDNRPARQGAGEDIPEPNKIGPSTPYDFAGRNLTAYGGLLPVATMLEKLGFQQTVRRDADGEASHAGHEHVSVRPGHGVGRLGGFFAIA
jgi:hypothetical protein